LAAPALDRSQTENASELKSALANAGNGVAPLPQNKKTLSSFENVAGSTTNRSNGKSAPGKKEKVERKMSINIDDDKILMEKLDKTEPIIMATFLLPYSVERNIQTGELAIEKCFHNPTMLNG